MEKNPKLTIAYIRDSVRRGCHAGDLFQALIFMLSEYDRLWLDYRALNERRIKEYEVKRVG